MQIDFKSFTKKFIKDPDHFPFGMRFYDGVMGSGKSLTMAKDCYDICQQYNDVLVISNLHFKIDIGAQEILYFQTIDELIPCLIYSQGRKHTWVIIDEALSYFAENGGIDPALMNKITQSRSCRRFICLGSQKFKRINNRLRDFSLETVQCRHLGRIQINSIRDDTKLRFDKQEMDFVGDIKYRQVFKRNIELFNLYDTFEGVKLNTAIHTGSTVMPKTLNSFTFDKSFIKR